MAFQYNKVLIFCFLTASSFLLVSCNSFNKSTIPPQSQKVINQAKDLGWQEQRYPINNSFIISTYEFQRRNHSESVIHAYIEGDGNSWKNKYKLSDNPTPKYPLTLKLALTDPHPLVVYLARPCQYTPHQLDTKCEAKYWSSHRYAPEVVHALNETLDQLKTKYQNKSFVLIGYSGGGSIAALIAAKRTDVKGLITIAGDLDHKLLNEYHRTTPLKGSENPMAIAAKLKKVPQQHWAGKQDPVVPPWMAQHFAEAVNNPACVKTFTLPQVTHHKGWEKAWPLILQTRLVCDKKNG